MTDGTMGIRAEQEREETRTKQQEIQILAKCLQIKFFDYILPALTLGLVGAYFIPLINLSAPLFVWLIWLTVMLGFISYLVFCKFYKKRGCQEVKKIGWVTIIFIIMTVIAVTIGAYQDPKVRKDYKSNIQKMKSAIPHH